MSVVVAVLFQRICACGKRRFRVLNHSCKWIFVTGVHCQRYWIPSSCVHGERECWRTGLPDAESHVRKWQRGVKSGSKLCLCHVCPNCLSLHFLIWKVRCSCAPHPEVGIVWGHAPDAQSPQQTWVPDLAESSFHTESLESRQIIPARPGGQWATAWSCPPPNFPDCF